MSAVELANELKIGLNRAKKNNRKERTARNVADWTVFFALGNDLEARSVANLLGAQK